MIANSGRDDDGNHVDHDDDEVFLYTGQTRSEITRYVKYVRIHPFVESIRKDAFKDCHQLVHVEFWVREERQEEGGHPTTTTMKCRLERIEWGAFNGCTSLTSIALPPTLKRIDDWSFGGCVELTTASFCDEGLVTIGNRAFKGCKSLTRIQIPSTVQLIDEGAFGNCERLVDVEICQEEAHLEHIGKMAFMNCKSLLRMKLPKTTRSIGEEAFSLCEKLEEIILPQGSLERIDKNAFMNCKSLRRITVPFSVVAIDDGTFGYCNRLEHVELFDGGLLGIGCNAFMFCSSLKCLKIPRSVKFINKNAFSNCQQLITVEISGEDGAIKGIDDCAFEQCPSLRNVAVPSSAGTQRTLRCFGRGCHDLQRSYEFLNQSFGSKEPKVDGALLSRFDGLPIHRLCYDQAHYRAEVMLERIGKALGGGADRDDVSIVMDRQDCIGMTPLHILSCSSKHNLDLYKLIIEHQPESLVTQDKWGCQPILYAIWCNAPQEIIRLLVDSQKELFPDFHSDWNRMLETLCRALSSPEIIMELLDIHRVSFSDQNIYWQMAARELTMNCMLRSIKGIVYGARGFFEKWQCMMEDSDRQSREHYEELLHSLRQIGQTCLPDENIGANWQMLCEELVSPLKGWWRPDSNYESMKMFRFLVKCGLSERSTAIGIRKWRTDIQTMVESSRRLFVIQISDLCDKVHSLLARYEQMYLELKESTSLLELAIWKSKIDEFMQGAREVGVERQSEKFLVDDLGDVKGQCRINCGVSIIIPNVVMFLTGE